MQMIKKELEVWKTYKRKPYGHVEEWSNYLERLGRKILYIKWNIIGYVDWFECTWVCCEKRFRNLYECNDK